MPILFPFPTDPVQTCLKREGLNVTSQGALAIAADLHAGIISLDRVPAQELTWEQTFGAMDRIHFAVSESADIPALFALVHPDGLVRESARECEPRVEAFITELYMDDIVYRVLKRAESTLLLTATTEQKKLISDILREYRRNGLELSTADREQLKKLNSELTKLGQTFEQNIAESKVSISISPEQLLGLPEQYIASHQPNEEGDVIITSDPPDIIPFLRYANDRNAALELFTKSENRVAKINLPILDQVLSLRKKKANLLGYATWADYILEERMAKTPNHVIDFLDSLHKGLQTIRNQEVALIENTAVSQGRTSVEKINDPDSVYYSEKVRNIEYGLDSKILSEYFEISAVERGILDIASSLYGISFRQNNQIQTWHPDVRVYEVFDHQNVLTSRVYLDLYPRDNKYKHAAMFTLRPTMTREDGTRVVPIVALVCNFPKPGEQPALLEHSQVTTLFHEFGHCLHLALSRTTYAYFSGTRVRQDFVEVPSQLFEEWAWNHDVLNQFARHYETGASIPDELVKAMQSARRFGQGLGTDRQIFYASLDLTYHTKFPVDTTQVLQELYPTYCPFSQIPDTHFQSHFGHLMGYDASYYSYQWALSIAKDIYTQFEKNGIMNPDTARSYLKTILERGGSQVEDQMVKDFLGRPSSPDAYLEFLGIEK